MFTSAFEVIGYDKQNDADYIKSWETVKANNRGGSYFYGTAYQDYSGCKLIMFVWKTEQERYNRDFCRA